MSVHKAEQYESKMDVQTFAAALVDYTITEANKENVVAKRNHWSIGERLINAALDAAVAIDMANSMRIEIAEEARIRLVQQDLALAAIFRLKILIQVARNISGFAAQKQMHWTRLATNVQKLVTGWKDSDRLRKRKP